MLETYGRHFDDNKFWARSTPNRGVVNAFSYAIGRGDHKQRVFQNIL
nr:hypothetical protein [Halomonas sp. 18H]